MNEILEEFSKARSEKMFLHNTPGDRNRKQLQGDIV